MTTSRPLLALGAALLLAVTVACDGGADDGEPTTTTAPQPHGAANGDGDGDPRAASAAPMPLPRTEVAGAAWEGGVVVVGGLTADGSVSARADVWRAGDDAWEPPRPPDAAPPCRGGGCR